MSHKMGKGKERRRSQLNGNTTGQTKAQAMKQNNGQYDYEFGQESNMGKQETRERNIKNPMTPNGNKVNQTPYKNKYQYEFSKEPVAGTGQKITNRKTNQKISDRANLKTDRYDLEFGEDSSLQGTGMVPQRFTSTQKVNNKANLKTDRYDYEFGDDGNLRGGQSMRNKQANLNSKAVKQSRTISTDANSPYKYEFSSGNSNLDQLARETKQKYQAAETEYKNKHKSRLYNQEFGKETNTSKYQTSTKNYNAANQYKEEFGKGTTITQGYGQSSGYMQSRGLMKSSLPSNKYNEEYGQSTFGTRANQNLTNRGKSSRTPSYGESYSYDQISSTYKRGANKNYNVEFGGDNMTNHSQEFNYKKDGISSKATEMANRYTEEYGLEGPEANPRTLNEKMQSDEYVGKSQRGLYNTSKKYKTEFGDSSPHSMFTAGKQVAAEKFKQKFQNDLQQNYNVEIAKENLIKKDDNDEK